MEHKTDDQHTNQSTKDGDVPNALQVTTSRTQCFTDAQSSPSILLNRSKLTDYYLREVESMQRATDSARFSSPRHKESKGDDDHEYNIADCGLPAHTPAVLQLPGAKKTIRVAQWNVNVLHGPDNVEFSMPQRAAAIATVVKALNADVLLLQEAWKLSYPPGKAPNWPDSSSRVSELIDVLPSLGYRLVACEEKHNFNPSLLATRLPIVETGEAFSTDVDRHPFAQNMLAQRSPELRAARIVDLALGTSDEDLAADAPVLSTVITHFHHNEAPAAPSFGIRKGEAGAIVAECNQWTARHGPERRRQSATLIATDFNGVRKEDLEPHEWALHSKCMQKLGQPADDGVAACLKRSGFQCTYDAPGMNVPKLTHWTNTVLDFAYLRAAGLETSASKTNVDQPESKGDTSDPSRGPRTSNAWSVQGVYVVPQKNSDHLPVVHDLVYVPDGSR